MKMLQNIFELTIPDEAWEETGVEEDALDARLLTTVCINGVNHHLEAFQVETTEQGIQQAVDIAFEGNIGGICDVSEPDGHWQTVTIKGKEYALAMTPFC
jgi:hypothetical protein